MTGPSRRRPRRRRIGLADAGSSTAETVILMPLGFLLLWTAVQFGVWAHATHIAHAAADTGLAHARAHHTTEAGAHAHTQAVLEQLGGAGLLTGATVTVDRTPAQATVVIDGHAQAVVPGLVLPVHVQVSGPVDRFTTPGG
jgi:Flp pilus assembly protein TadG